MHRSGNQRLCPCGSGKQYKVCCGARGSNVIDLEERRWQIVTANLQNDLADYANQGVWAQAREEAFIDFFDGEDPEVDDYLWDRFMDWFLFDYPSRDSHPMTILESFQRDKHDQLDERARQLLEQWIPAVISLYEVIYLRPGKGITVKDLLRGGRFEVLDAEVVDNVTRHTLLITRLLQLRDGYRFSVGATVLPPFFKGPLLRDIRSRYHDHRSLQGESEAEGWNGFLRLYGYKVDDMVDAITELTKPSPVRDLHSVKPSGDGKLRPALLPEVERFLKDLILDDYYRQWIDQPLSALGGRTPRELVRSESGRKRLEKLLLKMDIDKAVHGAGVSPLYNVSRLKKMLGLCRPGGLMVVDNYPWSTPADRDVARQVVTSLEKARFTPEQVGNAISLWYDFVQKERIVFRKVGVWAAAIVYALARMEFDYQLTQQKLAGEFGVAVAGISHNYSRIREVLGLKMFDPRYCSVEPPVQGFEKLLT